MKGPEAYQRHALAEVVHASVARDPRTALDCRRVSSRRHVSRRVLECEELFVAPVTQQILLGLRLAAETCVAHPIEGRVISELNPRFVQVDRLLSNKRALLRHAEVGV